MTDKQLIKECTSLFKSLQKDAEMALNGTWDYSNSEGTKGFQCQIDLISKLLDIIKENKKNENI